MKVILLLLSINIILRSITCINMDIWEYISSTIITNSFKIYTGITYLGTNDNYIISYIDNEASGFLNFKSNTTIAIKDKVIPTSFTIKDNFHVIFTKNNDIYSYTNIGFNKKNTNIVGAKSLIGGIIQSENSQELIIGFTGTDRMILYRAYGNYLISEKKYDLEGKEIVSLHAEYINNVNYIHFLFKIKNEYMFALYSLNDADIYMVHNSTNNFEFYNITEIYRIFINNHLIHNYVFSYDKNSTNFVFYLFEYTDNEYIRKKFRNKYNFLPFQNAKIMEAFFLPNTEYLYYLIEINNQRYAGVLDVINNIIVFNFKTRTEFISYQDYYLLYSESNYIYRLCPFNTRNGDNCDLYLNNTRQLIQITSQNTIISKCTTDAPYILGVFCYDKCPLGYYSSGFVCEKCHIFDNDEKKCVDSCQEDKIFDELNKVCYSCKQFNQYKNKELNICVDDCYIYNLLNDETKYVCNSCQESDQYWQEGNCVDDCGADFIKVEEKNICVKCSEDKPYYQKGECVKECNENYILDIKSKNCIYCTSAKKYLQDGKCVQKCDDFHRIDQTSKNCINCQNELDGPFLQDNKCVEKCEINYKIDEKNKICINCSKVSPETPFLQDNQCVAKCKDFYGKDTNLKRCYNCTELGNNYYFYNGTCIEECPTYFIKDDINKRCYKCDEENANKSNIYYEDGKCVEDCRKFYYKDNTQNICINCTEKNPDFFFQDNLCVKSCNKYYAIDYELKICINCSAEYTNSFPYYMNNKCVKECDSQYIIDENNKVCYKCKDEYKDTPYTEHGKCVKKCSQYLAIEDEDLLCINCADTNNTLYEEQKCVEKCSPGYAIAPYTKACVNCHNEFHQYEFKGTCLTECPNNTVINREIYQCQQCYIVNYSTPFFDELSGKCIEDCPYGTEKDLDKFTCKKCLKYYNNVTKKCLDECPKGSSIVGNICQKCNIYEPTNDSCVSQCLSGNYPYYIQEEGYSLCYNGFCGLGVCQLNESNYKVNQSNINLNNLYFCNCQTESVYGKYCQYENIKNFINQGEETILIKPLQDIAYSNRRNVFTFEFIDDRKKNYLRELSIDHSLNINRRIQYIINWKLYQKNCIKNQNKNITSNDFYFILDPDSFVDDCDNNIDLIIYDIKNQKIAGNTLYVKTKSLNPEDFFLKVTTNITYAKPLDNNSLFKIYIIENGKEEIGNYIYKYLCVTEEGEEYSLTNYMRKDTILYDYELPYCENLKARIKNDFGYTLEILSERLFIKTEQYKDLPTILFNYDLLSNNVESVFNLMNELKTFFRTYENDNISNEKDFLDKIISFLGIHLTESIKKESEILKSNISLDEVENRIEPNVFISTINQLALFYHKNDFENKNDSLFIDLKDIIYNSLNSIDIDFLTEETILSYLRTIDNLIKIMDDKQFMSIYNISELYSCINILKKLLLKNMMSGTSLKLIGKYFEINLVKPGYYTEEISVEPIKIEEDKIDFMQYNNYKIEINKNIKNMKSFGSGSLFSMSKEN